MQIEFVSPAELVSFWNNARTHSKRQIKQLAKSIERFGFTNPILVDDKKTILAGHGRLEAAKLLGLEQVPIVRLSKLTDVEKRAYVLADNRLAEQAGWDKGVLRHELEVLIDLDFDIELTGFTTADIDSLIETIDEADPNSEDNRPEYRTKAVSRPGDLWVMGPHKLLCADARDEAAYANLMGSDLAQFIFTDPPYNVPIDGHVCGLGRVRHRDFAMGCGEMSQAEFSSFLERVFQLLRDHSADGSIHQICMEWRHMREMLEAGHKVYQELKNLCVWNKNNAGMGTFYRSKHELVFVWKSGAAPHINNFELGQYGRSRSNVWDYSGVNTLRPDRMQDLAMHPTVKPAALVADAIKDCSRRGGVVLDPFCGSGTVLIAAERTGRKARAIEIDPHYVDVAVQRWQTFTGKTAVLSPSRDSFEAVAEKRHVVEATRSGLEIAPAIPADLS
jgi:DNA modification methylase